MALHDFLDSGQNEALVKQVEQLPLPPPGSMLRRRYDLAKAQQGRTPSERSQEDVARMRQTPKGGGSEEFSRASFAAALAAGSRGHVAAWTAEDRLGARSAGGKSPNFDPRNPAVSSDFYDEEAACQIQLAEDRRRMDRDGRENQLQGLKDFETVRAIKAAAERRARAEGRQATPSDVQREALRLARKPKTAGKKKAKAKKLSGVVSKAGSITVDLPPGGLFVAPGPR